MEDETRIIKIKKCPCSAYAIQEFTLTPRQCSETGTVLEKTNPNKKESFFVNNFEGSFPKDCPLEILDHYTFPKDVADKLHSDLYEKTLNDAKKEVKLDLSNIEEVAKKYSVEVLELEAVCTLK